MSQCITILLTMLAPVIWGTTYIVTSKGLIGWHPITIAMLRALPVGLLLLIWLRRLPAGRQWAQAFVLGGLNFTIFWICLFVVAQRLPGGVGALILGATQPLIVIFLTYAFFHYRINLNSVLATIAGVGGVALLVLESDINLDPAGIIFALLGAVSMALGTVLSKKWRGDISLLTFTGWQLTAGGVLLLPFSLYVEPQLPTFEPQSLAALVWLSLAGALLSYVIWFNGIARLSPLRVSILGFLSPVTAIVLGWVLLKENLNALQIWGICAILASILFINTTTQEAT